MKCVDPWIVPYTLATLKCSHALTSWTCADFSSLNNSLGLVVIQSKKSPHKLNSLGVRPFQSLHGVLHYLWVFRVAWNCVWLRLFYIHKSVIWKSLSGHLGSSMENGKQCLIVCTYLWFNKPIDVFSQVFNIGFNIQLHRLPKSLSSNPITIKKSN